MKNTGFFNREQYTNEYSVSYNMYKIHFGEPTPLICVLDKDPFDSIVQDSNSISGHWSLRKYMTDPIESGSSFVLDYVKNAFKDRLFSIHGKLISVEILFAFLDRYAHCLGLMPKQNEYSIIELENGLNNIFPGICARILQDTFPSGIDHMIRIDLDEISEIARHQKLHPLHHDEGTIDFIISSNVILLNAVSESIRYLLADMNNDIIKRPFKHSSQLHTTKSNWIWSGYTVEEEEHNIMTILNSVINEYAAFIKGNRLKLPESPYLDQKTSIIFVFENKHRKDNTYTPILNEYHISTVILLTIEFSRFQAA